MDDDDFVFDFVPYKIQNEVEPIDEIELYLKLPQLPLDCSHEAILSFWRSNKDTLPTLSRLALIVLSPVATSVPVERLFSEVKNLCSSLQNAMYVDSLEDNAMIKKWESFFSKRCH